MATEAIGPVKAGRRANRKVYGGVSPSLKMLRFKRYFEEHLEDVGPPMTPASTAGTTGSPAAFR